MTGTLGRLVAQTLAPRTGTVRARIAPSFAPAPAPQDIEDDGVIPAAPPTVARQGAPFGPGQRAAPGDRGEPATTSAGETRRSRPRERPGVAVSPEPLTPAFPEASLPPGLDEEHASIEKDVTPIDRLMAFLADEPVEAPSPDRPAPEGDRLSSASLRRQALLLPAQPAASAAPFEETRPMSPPAIEISIGRIEVRADPPRERVAPPRPASPAPSRLMSLEDHLRGGRPR